MLQAEKMAQQPVLDAGAAAQRVELAAKSDKNRNVLAAGTVPMRVLPNR